MNAFLIDEYGKAVMHPALRPTSEMLDSPMLVNVKNLEMHNNAPTEFASTIYPAMVAGTTGSTVATNAPRFQANGDFSDGVSWTTGHTNNYWYGRIAGSKFSFAFNLANSDLNYKKAAPTYTGDVSGCGAPSGCPTTLIYRV